MTSDSAQGDGTASDLAVAAREVTHEFSGAEFSVATHSEGATRGRGPSTGGHAALRCTSRPPRPDSRHLGRMHPQGAGAPGAALLR